MRYLMINGQKHEIPPYPHHKDYVYRCRRYFEAKSIPSFMSIAKFRVFKELFKSVRYQTGIPRDILIDPTNACNLNCTGCWSHDYDNARNLSLEKMDEIFTQAEQLGTMDILFTGGEPMIRKDDILTLAQRHSGMFFGLFTNATLIDEAFVKKVKELGNISFFISIEGFREDTDFRRGKGTFDKVVKAMDLLKANDIAFAFSLCYHSQNYKTVTSDEFLDFLLEKGAWYGWAFAYRPIGKDADMGLCLNAEQREYARNKLSEYAVRKQITIIDLFNSGHKVFGCVAAGSGYIHINANGDVEPCAFCHYSDSNIHEVSLQEAMRSPFFRAFRKAQPFSPDPLRPCPMMDVPEAIVELVESTDAKSTHISNPETAVEFSDKVQFYATEWEAYTKSKSRRYSRGEMRRYKAFVNFLNFRKKLTGDN